jgi:hypothetical protein
MTEITQKAIPLREAMKALTVRIRITGARRLSWRIRIAALFFRAGGRAAGCQTEISLETVHGSRLEAATRALYAMRESFVSNPNKRSFDNLSPVQKLQLEGHARDILEAAGVSFGGDSRYPIPGPEDLPLEGC